MIGADEAYLINLISSNQSIVFVPVPFPFRLQLQLPLQLPLSPFPSIPHNLFKCFKDSCTFIHALSQPELISE